MLVEGYGEGRQEEDKILSLSYEFAVGEPMHDPGHVARPRFLAIASSIRLLRLLSVEVSFVIGLLLGVDNAVGDRGDDGRIVPVAPVTCSGSTLPSRARKGPGFSLAC